MKVSQTIRNVEKINAYLKTVPRGTVRAALEAFTVYIIGDESHGLSHDDPYGQTTRARVYGQPFESDAQRKKVMAMIRSGEIVIGARQYSPTKASAGYGWKETNGGYGTTITNTEPGAYWSRVWGGWKNWRSIPKVIADNTQGAIRSANAAVKKWLAQKG